MSEDEDYLEEFLAVKNAFKHYNELTLKAD
jgi:hypothetical protein